MSTWHLWMAGWVITFCNATGAFVAGLAASITESGRLGGVTGVFAVTAFLVGFGTLLSAIEGAPKRPTYSKADRTRLRDEQRRIDVDAEIRRMEREAGL